MFFYTALFIASVIIAVVILWLGRSLADVGKAVYQAFLPSSKANRDPTGHLDTQRLTTTINDTPIPWGWKGDSSPSQVARVTPAAPATLEPWGWSGAKQRARNNDSNQGSQNFLKTSSTAPGKKKKEKPLVGWPYREESFEFAGKSCKVVKARKLRKNHLKTIGKPWGW